MIEPVMSNDIVLRAGDARQKQSRLLSGTDQIGTLALDALERSVSM